MKPSLSITCVRGAVGFIRTVRTVEVPIADKLICQTFSRATLPLLFTTTVLCGCCWWCGAGGGGVGRIPCSLEEHPEPVIVVVGVSEEGDSDSVGL